MSVSRDRDRLAGRPSPARTPRRAPEGPGGPDEDALSRLQRAVGNSAMARLVDRATTTSIERAKGGGSGLDEVPEARRAAAGLARDAQRDGTAPGAALEEVRIHADPAAAEMAARLGAQAFTFGADVFLGARAPELGTPDGQALLRHELTHVLQQGPARAGRPRRVSDPRSAPEAEAARVASAGRPTSAEPAAADAVQRQGDEEEEEEVARLPDTVHRQVTIPEEEVETTVEAAEPAAPAEPAPANPALAALFDVAVSDNVRGAATALEASPPQPREAFDALRAAIRGSQAVAETYSETDRELMLELQRFANGLNVAREMLAPLVGLTRSEAGILEIVSGALGRSAEIRGRLH